VFGKKGFNGPTTLGKMTLGITTISQAVLNNQQNITLTMMTFNPKETQPKGTQDSDAKHIKTRC
jgi:hypothetical protein